MGSFSMVNVGSIRTESSSGEIVKPDQALLQGVATPYPRDLDVNHHDVHSVQTLTCQTAIGQLSNLDVVTRVGTLGYDTDINQHALRVHKHHIASPCYVHLVGAPSPIVLSAPTQYLYFSTSEDQSKGRIQMTRDEYGTCITLARDSFVMVDILPSTISFLGGSVDFFDEIPQLGHFLLTRRLGEEVLATSQFQLYGDTSTINTGLLYAGHLTSEIDESFPDAGIRFDIQMILPPETLEFVKEIRVGVRVFLPFG